MMRQEIDTLKRYLKEEKPVAYENLLRQILENGNPNTIGELLVLFDDDYDFDELLFSLIHGIESFNNEDYIDQLLENLIELAKRAPEWTKIILTRIKNNITSFNTLKKKYKSYPFDVKRIINEFTTDSYK